MDNGLFTASMLLAVIGAGLLYYLAKSHLPAMVMGFSELPEAEQKRVAKQKLIFRSCALGCFALAGVLLFMGMPRFATIIAVAAGFFFQYKVFCLRRKYPIRPVLSGPPDSQH